MNIFIMGLPKSGRTTVAQELVQHSFNSNGPGLAYINTIDWVKNTFRAPDFNETAVHFNDEYHCYLVNRIKSEPDLIINNLNNSIKSINRNRWGDGEFQNWVIDGMFSPRDFCNLFNYNEDMVVFLNRVDGEIDVQDYESIGISVIRDYCFWLSSADMLPKSRWLEYNFKIPGENSDSIKMLGSKNTVLIVKSISSVVTNLVARVQSLSTL